MGVALTTLLLVCALQIYHNIQNRIPSSLNVFISSVNRTGSVLSAQAVINWLLHPGT